MLLLYSKYKKGIVWKGMKDCVYQDERPFQDTNDTCFCIQTYSNVKTCKSVL